MCSYGQASSKDPYKLFEYRKSVVVAMLDITSVTEATRTEAMTA